MQAVLRKAGYAADHTPAAAVAAGALVVLGGAFLAHASVDIEATRLGALDIGRPGVYEVVKANGVIAQYAAIYWDADGNPQGGVEGSGCVTTTANGNLFFGYALVAAGATDTTVTAFRWPASTITNTVHETLSAVIADVATGEAIPVTNSGSIAIVTAAAETRTLAAPSFLGQMLSISLKTDGGDCVITCATTVNQTGNNTITLADAGDCVVLVAKQNGDDLRWAVLANDGATLATV